MAIKVMKKGLGDGCNCVTTFLCDTEEDINNLPTENSKGLCGEMCSAGSEALVLENGGSKWVLGNTGKWNQVSFSFPNVIGGLCAADIAGE